MLEQGYSAQSLNAESKCQSNVCTSVHVVIEVSAPVYCLSVLQLLQLLLLLLLLLIALICLHKSLSSAMLCLAVRVSSVPISMH
jgi:hypothetical protein